jgi:hypothetical protein
MIKKRRGVDKSQQMEDPFTVFFFCRVFYPQLPSTPLKSLILSSTRDKRKQRQCTIGFMLD